MDEQPQVMPEIEWRSLGERLFGADTARWRFRCPTCGTVISVALARAMPEESKERLRGQWAPDQECVGRYLAGQGCNWCAYGLFSGPFFVERDGERTPVFGFDIDTTSKP